MVDIEGSNFDDNPGGTQKNRVLDEISKEIDGMSEKLSLESVKSRCNLELCQMAKNSTMARKWQIDQNNSQDGRCPKFLWTSNLQMDDLDGMRPKKELETPCIDQDNQKISKLCNVVPKGRKWRIKRCFDNGKGFTWAHNLTDTQKMSRGAVM